MYVQYNQKRLAHEKYSMVARSHLNMKDSFSRLLNFSAVSVSPKKKVA
jgi:hypothetical protein